MEHTITYTLEDIKNIEDKFEAIEFNKNIITTLQNLSKKLTNFNKVKPYARSDYKKRHNGNGKHYDIDNTSWETTRNFKVTKKQTQSDIQKDISFLRNEMNKLTLETYTTILDIVKNKLVSIYELYKDDNGALYKIIENIFDISSQNKFYSNLYAKAYKYIIKIDKKYYDMYLDIIDKQIDSMFDKITNIKHFDPDKNYDAFCIQNEINSKNKTIGIFLINCAKENIISYKKVYNIIFTIQSKITEYITKNDHEKIVDELSEMLFEFIPILYELLNEKEKDQVIQYLDIITELNIKEYPSLSGKSSFKHMDIQDLLCQD